MDGAVASHRQIHVGVADGPARLGADVDTRPAGAAVAAFPKRRRRFSIAGDEQRAVCMFGDHGFTGYDVEVIDGVGHVERHGRGHVWHRAAVLALRAAVADSDREQQRHSG